MDAKEDVWKQGRAVNVSCSMKRLRAGERVLSAHNSCCRRAKHSLDVDPSALGVRDRFEGRAWCRTGCDGAQALVGLSGRLRKRRSAAQQHDARRGRVWIQRVWGEGDVGGS
jgi:hypothetical protein